MTKTARFTWAAGVLLGIAVFAILGQYVAPPQHAGPGPTGLDPEKCAVDAPDAIRAAARNWCANGLFTKVDVKADAQNVVAALRFSMSGAQAWQIRSGPLMSSFRGLTDQLSDASGTDVAVSLSDVAGNQVGACARRLGDASAKCERK